MSGMIRLRPTQILLTSEEVSKALHKFRPINPEFLPPSPATLSWDHNIAARRHRDTKGVNKTAHNFIIHEDLPMNDREVDSGEMSDMSDFSFGPIHLRRNPSDGNSLLVEANNGFEAGGKDSDDEQGSESTSWDGRHSVTTLTNDSPTSGNFISSTLIDGSISSADEQQDTIWEVYSDGLTEHDSSSEKGESFIDIEYLADVELSVPEASGSSAQSSDAEDRSLKSYSLPMDGASEEDIRHRFRGMNIYASPAVPPLDEGRVRSRWSPDSRTPGTPGTPSAISLPPTPSSVRRLLEEVSPRLDDVAGFSPLHVAVSRARLARYRSRSFQHSVLTGLAGDDDLREDGHHQRLHTSEIPQRLVFNSSPPLAHVKRCVMTVGTELLGDEPNSTNTDDSDGGIQILEQVSRIVNPSGRKKSETGDQDGEREDAARELSG